MCGRYASLRPSSDLAAVFDAVDATGEQSLSANYNVAPTSRVPVIRMVPVDQLSDGEPDRQRSEGPEVGDEAAVQRVVSVARWGLLPPWAGDVRAGARMINARAETVRTSRAYRSPFQSRRCLVPADGWYEWASQGGVKQPYYLTRCDGQVSAFAGLWQTWGPDRLLTTTVLTTAAAGELATIHQRMPLVLPAELWALWLSGDSSKVAAVVDSPPTEWVSGIELRPVGSAVGNVRNNSAALIEPVTGAQPTVNAPDPVDLTLF